MSTAFRSPVWLAILPAAFLSAQAAPPVGLARPVSASEVSSPEDPEFQAQLERLREKYNQDRHALKSRSSQLAPDERMKLHQALLDSHQTALKRLEQDAKVRTSNSKAKWEQRRNERSERLEEVRKDGSARKRRHGQDYR